MAAPLSASRGAPQGAASVLAEGLTLTGRVAGNGDLEVRGHLEGEVDLQGELTLAEGATLRANVSATRVVVRGALLGDVRAAASIVLEASARVVGDLTSPRITIALGAQLRGNLDMSEAEAAPAPEVRSVARPAAPARPVETRAPAPAARPMAQKGPITPAKPVAVTRSAARPAPAPAVVAAAAPAPEEAPAAEEPKADAPRKEPPSPVVPAIKKGQKAQPKRKAHEAK